GLLIGSPTSGHRETRKRTDTAMARRKTRTHPSLMRQTRRFRVARRDPGRSGEIRNMRLSARHPPRLGGRKETGIRANPRAQPTTGADLLWLLNMSTAGQATSFVPAQAGTQGSRALMGRLGSPLARGRTGEIGARSPRPWTRPPPVNAVCMLRWRSRDSPDTRPAPLAYDPEKWIPVFGKDH